MDMKLSQKMVECLFYEYNTNYFFTIECLRQKILYFVISLAYFEQDYSTLFSGDIWHFFISQVVVSKEHKLFKNMLGLPLLPEDSGRY